MKSIPVRHLASRQHQTLNTGRFNVRDVQAMLHGRDMVHPLHKHDFFFVLALQTGKGIHEIDFIKHELQDRSLFILRPGQVHQLELEASCTGYLMEFDTAFYQPKAIHKNFCTVDPERFGKMFSFLSHILGEYTHKDAGYIQAISSHLDLFFLEYVRQSRTPNNSPQSSGQYTQDRFEELAHLLETNIASMKNVSQYADLLHLSTYQLNAIAKASVGKTVSELINEQILLEAKRYLLATASQIKEVADHLGYEDFSYFIRFFKKHTGYTPEEFRKNFK